jgi:hypothetical protein
MGKSFAPSPTARVAAGCSRSTPRELPKLRELAVWAADRPEQMTGQALQPVRLRQVEADGLAHSFDERHEVTRDQDRARPTNAWSVPAFGRPA